MIIHCAFVQYTKFPLIIIKKPNSLRLVLRSEYHCGNNGSDKSKSHLHQLLCARRLRNLLSNIKRFCLFP
ncbi:hypothetical protein BKA69DRAFT_1047679 [Paraphysoderma sedebokerense]|nr:hypothetical protein BKA69DRAFT_1047679 [Paraphysoderma sedebokerense]